MTPEEAIRQLEKMKDDLFSIGYYGDFGKEIFNMAIHALKEVQQYREIGTVEECRKAVEKQKAIPVSIGIQNFYKCPKCQTVLRITDKYCHECGQAISWGESKEE